MYELQKIEKIEIKYQPRNKCFYIFTLHDLQTDMLNRKLKREYKNKIK